MPVTSEELNEMLSEERQEIEKYKWIRSEEVGRDLGLFACLDWIQKYAVSFRENWERRKRGK